jgi:hypothetical protein
MSAASLFFIVSALVVLSLLLLVATRTTKRQCPAEMDIFEALSQSRHCSRLSQMLQVLQPEDTEYLQQIGQAALMHGLRQQRRQIARIYLNHLQEEFETLLEISRAIAVMSPDVAGMQEIERLKLSVAFAMNCGYLRWRLRLRLQPFTGFALLTDMASDIARQLDVATARIAEAAVRGAAQPGPEHKKIGGL